MPNDIQKVEEVNQVNKKRPGRPSTGRSNRKTLFLSDESIELLSRVKNPSELVDHIIREYFSPSRILFHDEIKAAEVAIIQIAEKEINRIAKQEINRISESLKNVENYESSELMGLE
jgi:hypothetical protein